MAKRYNPTFEEKILGIIRLGINVIKRRELYSDIINDNNKFIINYNKLYKYFEEPVTDIIDDNKYLDIVQTYIWVLIYISNYGYDIEKLIITLYDYFEKSPKDVDILGPYNRLANVPQINYNDISICNENIFEYLRSYTTLQGIELYENIKKMCQ